MRSSLRANGSRERVPDDRLREAIHRAAQRKNGLLRRCAPRNDVEAAYASARKRGEGEEACTTSILGDGGAGEGVVHADRDQVEVLTDVIDDHRGAAGRRTRDNTERRQSDVSASHEEMVVFDGDRPAGEKAIFKTGADRAAGPGVAGGSGNQPRCAGDIVVKSGVNPWAALSEKERMSPGITD